MMKARGAGVFLLLEGEEERGYICGWRAVCWVGGGQRGKHAGIGSATGHQQGGQGYLLVGLWR